jgi:hypothetical protein
VNSEWLRRQKRILYRFFSSFFVGFMLVTGYWSMLHAGIRDRVVAFVDNSAITLSELETTYEATKKLDPKVTKYEVLNTMINRLLLLREAGKIGLEAASEDKLLKEYIDLKIRAFIRIKEKELLDFYNKHIKEFQGKEFDTVREDIENYLIEKELNPRLREHISELKKNVCVKIQLNQDLIKTTPGK